LWNDPGLLGRVVAAAASCRQARQPLSLLLLEIDHFDDLLLTGGPETTESLLRQLVDRLRAELEGAAHLSQLGDSQFAILWCDYDRQQSVEAARHLKRGLTAWVAEHSAALFAPLTLSVGIASVQLPAKNFPSSELIAAAVRCLETAQLSGGDTVKSIEMV
jgi:diguanylate cyclase (GGDEF)-like protein